MGNSCDGESNENQLPKTVVVKKKAETIIINDPVLDSNLYHNFEDAPPKNYARKVNEIPVLFPKISQHLIQLKTDPLQKQHRGINFPPYYIVKKKSIYLGEWKDGTPYGYGKMLFGNGTYFQGTFEGAQPSGGDGIYIYADGSYKRGEFVNGKLEGKGTFYYPLNEFKYTGQWKEGKPNGQGIQKYPDGCQYRGRFYNGVKNGKYGVFHWPNGKIYKGGFKDGLMHGEGVLKMEIGRGKGHFKGKFQNGNKVSGELITETGKYTGPFAKGQMQGRGVFQWDDGKIYEGDFKNGKLWGTGTLKFPNGTKITGEWQKGKNKSLLDVQEVKPLEVSDIKETQKKQAPKNSKNKS